LQFAEEKHGSLPLGGSPRPHMNNSFLNISLKSTLLIANPVAGMLYFRKYREIEIEVTFEVTCKSKWIEED
jgi:hypothetical protein